MHNDAAPETVETVISAADALLAHGRIADARSLLEDEEALYPLSPALQLALQRAYTLSGDALRAAAARLAATALAEANLQALFEMATSYLNFGQLAPAEKWLRVVLLLDPLLATAHQNLSSVLRQTGRMAEAWQHLNQAYARQWIFREPAPVPAATVLLLCAPMLGNVPVDHLLPVQRYTRVKCFVHEGLTLDTASAPLPAHDLVFNAIGDPDEIAPDDARLLAILRGTNRPLMNPPSAVARTRRDRLPELLQGLGGVLVPGVVRLSLRGADALANQIDSLGLAYPLILRPGASHGGSGVLLAHRRADVEASALGEQDVVYATQYHHYASADGLFRKYRMVFVDRQPCPYHLAISDQWMVHYFSADMLAQPWKLEEEKRFLDDPKQVLGAKAMKAVTQIGQRLDLDYAGVDFSVLPDGRVLVFEANPTMLVHPESEHGPLAHKNPAVRRIIDAFWRMVEMRSSGE